MDFLLNFFATVSEWFNIWAGLGTAMEYFNSGAAGFADFASNILEFFANLF